MTKQKETCAVQLTSCCPSKKLLTKCNDAHESISVDDVSKESMLCNSERSSLIVNGTAIFQGPNYNADLEFKELTFEVKIRKNGKNRCNFHICRLLN